MAKTTTDILIETLIDWNVDMIFGIPGDGVNAYLAERNANPRPNKWTAKAEAILEKIHRARAALDKADAA